MTRTETNAKTIVDMLFDARLFKDHVTRDAMYEVEMFIELMLRQHQDSVDRLKNLTDRIENLKKENKSEVITEIGIMIPKGDHINVSFGMGPGAGRIIKIRDGEGIRVYSDGTLQTINK